MTFFAWNATKFQNVLIWDVVSFWCWSLILFILQIFYFFTLFFFVCFTSTSTDILFLKRQSDCFQHSDSASTDSFPAFISKPSSSASSAHTWSDTSNPLRAQILTFKTTTNPSSALPSRTLFIHSLPHLLLVYTLEGAIVFQHLHYNSSPIKLNLSPEIDTSTSFSSCIQTSAISNVDFLVVIYNRYKENKVTKSYKVKQEQTPSGNVSGLIL